MFHNEYNVIFLQDISQGVWLPFADQLYLNVSLLKTDDEPCYSHIYFSYILSNLRAVLCKWTGREKLNETVLQVPLQVQKMQLPASRHSRSAPGLTKTLPTHGISWSAHPISTSLSIVLTLELNRLLRPMYFFIPIAIHVCCRKLEDIAKRSFFCCCCFVFTSL